MTHTTIHDSYVLIIIISALVNNVVLYRLYIGIVRWELLRVHERERTPERGVKVREKDRERERSEGERER